MDNVFVERRFEVAQLVDFVRGAVSPDTQAYAGNGRLTGEPERRIGAVQPSTVPSSGPITTYWAIGHRVRCSKQSSPAKVFTGPSSKPYHRDEGRDPPAVDSLYGVGSPLS